MGGGRGPPRDPWRPVPTAVPTHTSRTPWLPLTTTGTFRVRPGADELSPPPFSVAGRPRRRAGGEAAVSGRGGRGQGQGQRQRQG